MKRRDGQEWLARVDAFAKGMVAPAAAGWSMGTEPDEAMFRAATGLGLTGIEIPIAAGGLGFDFADKLAAARSLAAVDFGFSMSIINTHNVARRLHQSAADTLSARYLPDLLCGRISACTALSEPGAGSDAAAIVTRAREIDGGWVLDGEKNWIVNARHAGLAIIYAQCEHNGGAHGIGAFLVDLRAPGVERYAIDSAFAQTSIGTGGFKLNGVRVGSENLLLPPGGAFDAILSEINGARLYVAAMCAAMLGAALAEATAYGRMRNTFGMPLASRQGWRRILVRAEVDLAATEALIHHAASCSDDDELQRNAAQAKIHAVETCQVHLPALLHAMGAEGLRPERCFCRHLAAAQVAGLTDGANAILLDRLAQLKFGRDSAARHNER